MVPRAQIWDFSIILEYNANKMSCFHCKQIINAHEQSYVLMDIEEELRNILLRGFNELELDDDEHICEQCFVNTMNPSNEPNQDVDIKHCVCCGRNIRDKRSMGLPEGPLQQNIAEKIHPRQVLPGHRLCNPCYNVAHRRMKQQEDVGSKCILPNYRRSPETRASCFVRNCGNSELKTVPGALRIKLIKQNKFLIARRAVVCQEHIGATDWGILKDMDYSHRFTPTQIEYMMSYLNENQGLEVNDFENFEFLDDRLCGYWTGLSKESFTTILNESPALNERFPRYVKTALAIYLIKENTGDSNARLALLFKRSECYI